MATEGFVTPPPRRDPRHFEDADSAALSRDRSLHNRRRRPSSRDSFDPPDSTRDRGASVRKGSRRDGGMDDEDKSMVSGWLMGRPNDDGGRVAVAENDQQPSVYCSSSTGGAPGQYYGEYTASVTARATNNGGRESVYRGGLNKQTREFITPAASNDFADSSSDNESSIKTWLPGAPWSRNSLRVQRRKGKGRGNGKSKVGGSDAGATAQTGSPRSPADIGSSPQMTASTAPRPDQNIAVVTAPLRPRRNDKPVIPVAGSTGWRLASEGSRGESESRWGGCVIEKEPSSATSLHAHVDLASATKTSWNLRTLSGTTAATSAAETSVGSAVSATAASMKASPSSVSASNGRGVRPRTLRSEAETSAAEMFGGGGGGQGLGNPFNALASFNPMAMSQTTKNAAGSRMRLAPAGGRGRGDRVKGTGGGNRGSDSKDSAAALHNGESLTTGLESGFDAPDTAAGIEGREMTKTDQSELQTTEMAPVAIEGAAAPDGRLRCGSGPGRGGSSVTDGKEGARSRMTMRDDNWWRESAEKALATAAKKKRHSSSSSAAAASVARRGRRRSSSSTSSYGGAGAFTPGASPAHSTISSREQAERDRERLARRNGRRRSSWSVTYTPGYDTGTDAGSGSRRHRQRSSSGWGLTTDDEGRTTSKRSTSRSRSRRGSDASFTGRREVVLSSSNGGRSPRPAVPWAERAGVVPTPPPSYISGTATSGSGPRSFSSSRGSNMGTASSRSSMSTGYESSMLGIPTVEKPVTAEETPLPGRRKENVDGMRASPDSMEFAPPSPAGDDDFDAEDYSDQRERRNDDQRTPQARNPKAEGTASISPTSNTATPPGVHYPPPSPAGPMTPNTSGAKTGYGKLPGQKMETALEALARLRKQHYEAMRKRSGRAIAHDTACAEGHTTDEDESAPSEHPPRLLHRQSYGRGESLRGYRRGGSLPVHVSSNKGGASSAWEGKGSHDAAATARRGGKHQDVPYLMSTVSEGTPLPKASKLRQQHMSAEEAARAAFAFRPVLFERPSPTHEPDCAMGMSATGILHHHDQLQHEHAETRRTQRSRSRSFSEGASSKDDRSSSLRKREHAKKSPFVNDHRSQRESCRSLPTGAGCQGRAPPVIPPLPKVLFPQTKPSLQSDVASGTAVNIPPFLATNDFFTPRAAKKDASKSGAHPRSKEVGQRKPDRKEKTSEAPNKGENGVVGNGDGGIQSANVESGRAEGGAGEIAFRGKSISRTKSLRVRSWFPPPSDSASRGEKRSISLSAIPSRGEQNHEGRSKNSGKRGVARVCSALLVGWLWRRKSTNGGRRARRRMWRAGGWGGLRRRAVRTDGYVASSDSEDDHSSNYFPSDRGGTRVEAVKVASIGDTGAASSSSRSKFKRGISLGRLGYKNVEQTETASFSFVHQDNRVADRSAGVFSRKRNVGAGDEGKGMRPDIGGIIESDPARNISDKMTERVIRQKKSSSEMLAGSLGWLEASGRGGDGAGDDQRIGKDAASFSEEEDMRWINFNGIEGRGGGVVAVPRGTTVAAIKTDGGVPGRPTKAVANGPHKEDEKEDSRRMEALLKRSRVHTHQYFTGSK